MQSILKKMLTAELLFSQLTFFEKLALLWLGGRNVLFSDWLFSYCDGFFWNQSYSTVDAQNGRQQICDLSILQSIIFSKTIKISTFMIVTISRFDEIIYPEDSPKTRFPRNHRVWKMKLPQLPRLFNNINQK